MRWKLRNNFIKKPELIYDGGEPRKILYKAPSTNTKLDIWKDAATKNATRFSDEELSDLKAQLDLPYVEFSGGKESAIYLDGRNVEIYFTGDIKLKIVVAFTCREVSPGHYKCYVVGVFEKIENKGI